MTPYTIVNLVITALFNIMKFQTLLKATYLKALKKKISNFTWIVYFVKISDQLLNNAGEII